MGMLNKATLLDLLRHFIVFEKSKKEDPQTGVISISTVKKLAAYHQYYAVNAAVASTLRAACCRGKYRLPLQVSEPPASYGLTRRYSTAQGRQEGWRGVAHAGFAASRFRWCFTPARSCWRWITRR